VVRRQKELPAYLPGEAAAAEAVRAQIIATADPRALADLWGAVVLPAFQHASQMMQAGTSLYENAARPLRRALEKSVGSADTHALLSGLNAGGPLASLGPVLGLWQVSQGQLSRADFLAQYGHRGAHEFELSAPRPAEDPGWLEAQLATNAQVDVPALLAKQQAQHAAAWARYAAQYPQRAAKMQRQLAATAEAGRTREAARSGLTRMAGVLRAYWQRAGALTGLGDGAFFLHIEELLALLRGEPAGQTAAGYIPARQATHARYSALPPYPSVIRGRFDPFQWAADPTRRTDVYDADARPTPSAAPAHTLTGFAGAAGIVEGRVRVLNAVEAAGELQPGEILVASTTNIGWTPVFPRAAAVITDVGAPLSHAAIVARELGIPAVVGTGTATMRLRTGDRVRVNGGLGLVEVLTN
jgi:pyruvate,water dikinase